MTDDEFTAGDFVEILTRDHKTFSGWLEDITPHYVLIDGRGYAQEDVTCLRHA